MFADNSVKYNFSKKKTIQTQLLKQTGIEDY